MVVTVKRHQDNPVPELPGVPQERYDISCNRCDFEYTAKSGAEARAQAEAHADTHGMMRSINYE